MSDNDSVTPRPAAATRSWALRAVTSCAGTLDAVLHAFTAAPLRRLHASNTAAAMRDPRYAEIQNRRQREESGLITMLDPDRGLGMDEWNLQDEIRASVARRPWWMATAEKLSTGPLGRALLAREHAQQRRTRGWDDRAITSLDDHLCRTLGAQLAALADTVHSWPEPSYPSIEAWRDALRTNARHLTHYATRWDRIDAVEPDEEDRTRVLAENSLHWVANNLAHLWA
jgi:hypothetical protein